MEKISTDGQFPEKKWNLQVKLKQLRNVTELQEKSAVQSQFTATSTFKRQAERIKKLSEENKKLKQTLDSNIKGVDLQRRKAMQRNHPYQLAYHHKPTEKIIENISSIIFDKTKKLDKLRYEKQKIENNLTSLKGQLYSNYADKSDLNTWSAQEILNKLQNISVKLNAAITVKKTYEQLIQILKKDAQNYDKTLASLKYDRVIQSKCILSATEMGQKVSEDLSLLESECRNEEINIYTIMKEMDVTAKSMKSELDQNIASCNTAIRNESVTRLDSDEEKEVIAEDLNEFSSHSSLNRDPNDVEDIFKEIMTVTGITNIEDIYQRIDQQIEQNVKLLKQIHLKNTLRDKLLDQRNQLEGLLENLETSSLAAINSFRQEKASLVSELKKLVEKHHEKKSAIQKNSDFLSVIKLGLLSLSTKLDTLHSFNTLYSCMMDSSSTSQVDIDALDILKKVQQKLHILEYRIKSKNFTMTPALYLTGKKLFEEAIIQQNIVEHKEDEYDLAITMMMEEFTATNDSLVPTRADIKKQSYNLVKETHVEAADEYDLKLEPSSWEQIRTHRQKQ